MTEGAYTIHKHLNKPNSDFFSKTQALTADFNSIALQIYAHYAFKALGPSSEVIIKYYQCRLFM
jgi:hypothetical protein